MLIRFVLGFLVLTMTIITLSCSGSKYPTELSELWIENRNANKLIVNRSPDYGIDGRDGCVVLEEISMNILELSDKNVVGNVFDSKTKEPLASARLTLRLSKNGLTKKITLNSDTAGFYRSELDGNLDQIEVEYVPYRNLIIDFRKFKRDS